MSSWELSPPWSRPVTHAIGGLTDVGESLAGDYLLVVSHQGRGVYDLTSGERIARDRDLVRESDRDDQAHTVAGIGPIEGTMFVLRVFGEELSRGPLMTAGL